MKFTLKEKLKFARLHVDDGIPYSEISNKHQIEITCLKYAADYMNDGVQRPLKTTIKEENTRGK